MMKYILIILLFASCTVDLLVDNFPFIVSNISHEGDYCIYRYNEYFGQEFYDSCGKFQIGDTVTTCKYTRK